MHIVFISSTARDGAIPEADQRLLLAAIEQRPETYAKLMEQIRQFKDITPTEIAMFESANPGVGNTLKKLD